MNIRAQFIETKIAELGLTKKALAASCGISAQNISTIIRRGTCEPKTAGKLSAPVIKCKKTPRKKCRFVAERREKR